MLHVARTQPLILPAIPLSEWKEPSAAQDKDQFGNSNFVGFRFRAINPDGRLAWQGCTRSREDADAFLWALIGGTLHLEPALWPLVWPSWHPDIAPFAEYQFVTLSVKVSPTDTYTEITKPSDWNDSNNLIAALSGGASGGAARGASADRTSGGGAGGFVSQPNWVWDHTGTGHVYWRVGSGGAGVTRSTTGRTAGNKGEYSGVFSGVTSGTYYIRGSTITPGGGAAVASGSTCNGGTAGSTATIESGSTQNDGGRGGNVTHDGAASGAGGAAGDTGAGNNGTDSAAGNNGTDAGNGGTVSAGSAGSGSSGVTGTAPQTSGNGGTGSGLYNDGVTSVGPGGGSGGVRASATLNPVDGTSGTGGAYGAGTGGVVRANASGSAITGTAGQGFVAFVWTPAGGGSPLVHGGQLIKGSLIRGGRLVSKSREAA